MAKGKKQILGPPLLENPVEFFSPSISIDEVLSKSSFLMQAVVIPGAKTTDGQIIIAVTEPWYDIIEFLAKYPDQIYKIHPRKLEQLIAGAYEREGYKVTLTPYSGDLGRDIIAEKKEIRAERKDIGLIRIVEDVKRYKPDHLVKASEARSLVGVMTMDNATKGYLSTTSDFAPKLREDRLIKPLLLDNRLVLIHGDMIIERLIKHSNEKKK